MNADTMVKSMDFILSAAETGGKGCRRRERTGFMLKWISGSVWRMNLGGREYAGSRQASTKGLREQRSLTTGLYTNGPWASYLNSPQLSF